MAPETSPGRLGPLLAAVPPVWGLLALALRSGGLGGGEALVLALPLAAVLGGFGFPARSLADSQPLGRTALWRLILVHALAAAMASAVWVATARGLAAAAAPAFPGVEARLEAAVPLLTSIGGLGFLLAAALQHAQAAARRSHEAERRELDQRVLSREAELKALRAQLQPHFLFNALNSISALTTAHPAGARDMCVRLAEFLRLSLRHGQRDAIPLGEELGLVERYLAIEQVRFGDRLRVAWEVDENARAVPVPPLLLQPLVENAVGHGIAGLVEGGVVRVAAGRAGDRLWLEVENPVDVDAPPRRRGEGVGLENVRRRLAAASGGRGRLEAGGAAGSFRVRLELPAEPEAAPR
ncbi:MAG: histidine kinase [Vicinamibacteria bacterium]|nr:histidine kinase [Vicinamibacteria bacterium]